MDPITIPNISIPTISIPTIGIPSVGFPSASGGGGLSWPAGMKEHIKAIYDPASQGMTNYDVIEAYVENFTTWNYLSSRGSATVTTNKIIITKSFSNTQNIIEDNKSPYDDIKIYVTGISEDNPLTINQYVDNKWVRLHTYTTDGIYIVKNRNLYVGFGTYITDDCNITITQLPTSILKDLSGNGNHAYLYGGKGKLNSGMGLYKVDFTSWRKSSVQTEVKPDVVKVTPNTSDYLFIQYANSVEIPSYKIKVIGLGDNVLKYQYATENGRKEINIVEGENELPTSIKVSNDYQIGYRLTPGTSVFTITQIPDYPDQLCYDGGMCAVAYEFPILTDYTIIADRTWFDIRDISCFIGKRNGSGDNLGAFEFEFRANKTFSFGGDNNIIFADNNIVYQTKNSYNGAEIKSGSLDDTDVLIIGAAQRNVNDKAQDPYIGCHGKIIIADRSFTEDEITWLKDNWEKI
jgi:hypothetical protein